MFGFGNRGDRPRQTTGQRLTGMGLTFLSPLLGTAYRGYTNNLNSANDVMSRAGTATGGMNFFGNRGNVGQSPNEALAQGMQQYQQGLGLDHAQNAMNAEANQGAVMDLPGAAGSVVQNSLNQPSTQQQIGALPAAMQTWIRNNGLPQTPNDIRRATNAMYLEGATNMANSNYGQDIGFIAPQARAPRER